MVLENQIIEGCKQGKRESFNVLYQKYAPKLLGICCRYSKTKAEAEDVLQDGFIKIFKKIKTYEGKGSIEGWLRRVMINTAINNYRSSNKHYYHEDIETDTNINLKTDEISFDFDDNITDKQIMSLIQELPSGYNMVFNLFVIDGLSHQEIANELNITVNTSKSQLYKARKWLQLRLLEFEKNIHIKNFSYE